jgi:serine/threonine-protein kinase
LPDLSQRLKDAFSGRYRIERELGRGGMSTVFLAEDLKHRRPVAIKVLDPEVAAVMGSERFLREIETVARLTHPHILAMHDSGVTEGLLFYVMPFVEGASLRDRLAREKQLPLEDALRIAREVADALSYAHGHGLVHRDIKPENILLLEGHAVVADFGIARAVAAAGGEQLTATGLAVGTPAYMSPEQAAGCRDLDGRSDLYSLGCVLYEMLAGVPPFVAATAQSLLHQHLNATPRPVTELRPAVPAAVAEALQRALAKAPADRAATLGRFADVLRASERDTGPTGSTTPARAEMPTERLSSQVATQSQDKTIAVLPFANMSGDREDDYLCEGLAEEIINALVQIPGLRVIARTSSFVVGRLGLDVREAGARLGVENILEGSVRRARSRVRVTAQLISTRDGSHLWSERYDRELTDLLVLEDDVAAAVAGRLRGELGREGGGRRRPAVDPEAHAAFLEGRHHFAKGTPEALAKANACYARALERDPAFAVAYDSMAELHWFLGFFGNVPPRDAFSSSTWYTLRALELDDRLAEAHALLGMLRKELDYNWPEVDRELRRALELNPGSPLVKLRHAISGLLPHGRVVEAMTEIEGIVRIDPLSVHARWWLSVMELLAGRLDRMDEGARHMISLDPGHFLGYWVLGMHRDTLGAGTEAVAALERAHELSRGSPFTLGFLALAYGRAGRADDARGLLERAAEVAKTAYVPPSTFAFGHIGLGDWNAAFERLDEAIDVRDPLVMPIKTYPFLEPARGDSRYQALLRKMNL